MGRLSIRWPSWLPALRPGLVLLCLVAAAGLAEAAEPARRLALVIGNGAYRHVEALRNPVEDAGDVAARLGELGFEVITGTDRDGPSFKALLDEAAAGADTASAVVFYYAGHGFEIDGVNRLVPVDALLRERGRIAEETIALDEVVARLSRPGNQVIVFLDACRNNPLPPAMRRGQEGEGLARVDTGSNVFIAFATEPHAVALDGRGRNSHFTEALLTHMKRPGLSVADMMVDVRRDVFASTKGRQQPWDQSSLRTAFAFMPEEGAALAAAPVRALDTSPPAGEAPTDAAVAVVEPEQIDSAAAQQLAAVPDEDVLLPIETSDSAAADVPAATSTAKPAAAPARPKPQTAKKPTTARRADPGPGKRPHATRYSFSVWPKGEIRTRKRVTRHTQFGTLSCRAMYSVLAGHEISRNCSWR